MRKIMPALSVVLAITLVLGSMPAARAAEIPLRAEGVVLQSAPADQDPAVILAQVTEGAVDWSDLPELSVFADLGGGKLCPGVSGSYGFTLHNKYDKPIQYTFTCEGKTAGMPLSFELTAGAAQGEVPVGGSVAFELAWGWPYEQGATPAAVDANDAIDTGAGVESRENPPLTYEVVLKFYIEADEGSTGTLNRWWLAAAIAALAAGGVVVGSLTLPWLLALPLVPVLLLLGWKFCGDKLCPPEKCNEKSSDYVAPPKTGDDSWGVMLVAGMGIVMAGAGLALMVRRRKKGAMVG